MERRTPYLGLVSCGLLLLAVATPFVAMLVWPAPVAAPSQSSSEQNAQAWHSLGVLFGALFVMIGVGLLATFLAIAALVRREKYRLLPVLVILVGGGGSAYLLINFFVN